MKLKNIINKEDFEIGWIDLDGNTYSCEYMEHLDVAFDICEANGYSTYRADVVLEDLGWVKITRKSNYEMKAFNDKSRYSVFCEKMQLTKKQADKLLELGMQDNVVVKTLIELSEDTW